MQSIRDDRGRDIVILGACAGVEESCFPAFPCAVERLFSCGKHVPVDQCRVPMEAVY